MTEAPEFDARRLASEIAILYREHYGRGPTKITAHLLPGAVVCLLEDVNTPAQNALIRRGRLDLAQTVHGEVQLGMADAMNAAVERHTGRRVRAYICGFNAEANATTDTFFLDPGP